MDTQFTAREAVQKRRDSVTDEYNGVQNVDPIETFIDSVTFHGYSKTLHWIKTVDSTELLRIDFTNNGLANLSKINNIRRINKFLEEANRCLSNGQILVVKVEPKPARRKWILQRYYFPFNYLIYFADFLVNRVVPKIGILQKPYFHLTKGKNRPLSLTEALGRLISCGFQIIEHKEIDGTVYIVSKKVKPPVYDMDPTYFFWVRLQRIAQNGNLITVYKIRTMHPYSEYVQDYLFNRYGTEDGDKIRNDFRVTSWGRIFRKLWIDEIPMLLNLLKGEIKIVGVRPLSRSKFNTYPESLQKLRTQFKPGLIPPYYADLPKTQEEFFESEERYLRSYAVKPIRTDLAYFRKALYNILIKGERSG